MRRFLLAILLASPLWSSMLGAPDICPVIDMEEFNRYADQKVTIKEPQKPKLGKNSFEITLSKPKLPSGYLISAFLDIIEKPEGKFPEILDGYPKSDITFYAKGEYKIKLRVNLVYRGS